MLRCFTFFCSRPNSAAEEVEGDGERAQDRRQGHHQRRPARPIISIKDDAVQLRVPPDNLRLEVARSSIASVAKQEEAA